MNKKCYIVGAGEHSGTNFHKGENEYVIAADGGLRAVQDLGITPDLILGDFDSLGFVPEGEQVLQFPVDKDDTDMMLAVKKAVEMGCREIEIYGGTGGRIDHTIANFQTMLWAALRGCSIRMIDAAYVYYVIAAGEITLPARTSGDLSLFAIGGKAEGVSVQGAKYTAQQITLVPDSTLAVSNSYIGNPVSISVAQGSLLIISALHTDEEVMGK